MGKRVALITGASQGVGKQTVELFLEQQITVIAVARNEENLNLLQKEFNNLGEIHCFSADVTKSDQVKNMVKEVEGRFGRIDMLINNAGGSGNLKKDIEKIEENEWHNIIDLNLTSVYLCCKFIIPLMKEQKWGRIVNVSSVGGRKNSFFGSAAYSSAKAGVLGLTRQVALEVAPYNITVNAVAPGWVHTERIKRYWETKDKQEFDNLCKAIPIGRPGKPIDIAAAISYLCSENASYITGICLDVNGGLYMG